MNVNYYMDLPYLPCIKLLFIKFSLLSSTIHVWGINISDNLLFIQGQCEVCLIVSRSIKMLSWVGLVHMSIVSHSTNKLQLLSSLIAFKYIFKQKMLWFQNGQSVCINSSHNIYWYNRFKDDDYLIKFFCVTHRLEFV